MPPSEYMDVLPADGDQLLEHLSRLLCGAESREVWLFLTEKLQVRRRGIPVVSGMRKMQVLRFAQDGKFTSFRFRALECLQ